MSNQIETEQREHSDRGIRRIEIRDGGGVFTVETDGQTEALRLLARLIARGLKKEALAKETAAEQTMAEAGRAA